MAHDTLRVRDFIYLDVDRLKSILAQIDKGYIEQQASTRAQAKTGSAGAEAAIPGLVKLGGTGQLVWSQQATETRTLHDHIYAYVEERLKSERLILDLNERLDEASWLDPDARATVASTAYVLVRGRMVFNDLERMRTVLREVNDIVRLVAKVSLPETPQLPEPLNRAQRRQELRSAPRVSGSAQPEVISSDLQELLEKIFHTLMPARYVAKVFPFPSQPEARITASLDQTQWLRESPNGIIYKFGTAPSQQWTLFGQVASIPEPVPDDSGPVWSLGGSLDVALAQVFRGMRELDRMAGSVSYPEIAVTPIAIYRG
jgi:hypothetical protein